MKKRKRLILGAFPTDARLSIMIGRKHRLDASVLLYIKGANQYGTKIR